MNSECLNKIKREKSMITIVLIQLRGTRIPQSKCFNGYYIERLSKMNNKKKFAPFSILSQPIDDFQLSIKLCRSSRLLERLKHFIIRN